jgi:hypothetical protein
MASAFASRTCALSAEQRRDRWKSWQSFELTDDIAMAPNELGVIERTLVSLISDSRIEVQFIGRLMRTFAGFSEREIVGDG